MDRRQNFQTIAWFRDLHSREMLDMDPPYQRRSVWNQSYKDHFVDTLLHNYPAPAIFLYEEIQENGVARYHLVDGKQRLSTIFEFAEDEFPVAESCKLEALRGRYFSQLDSKVKKEFWGYEFLVEYLPSSDESVIKEIFDRLNRNVAKLTRQELRHAKYSGDFISTAERLTDVLTKELPGLPRIVESSRRQMKDVEYTATLLLLLESGPRGYSQNDLDVAFNDRDEAWEDREGVEQLFREVVGALSEIFGVNDDLGKTRLRNQVDFFSLFGAVAELLALDSAARLSPEESASRLLGFAQSVDDESARENDAKLLKYYESARSAANDTGPRKTRMEILRQLLLS